MSARDDIFAAIERGLTSGPAGALPRRSETEIRAEAAALLAAPGSVRPKLTGPDPVSAFIEKCAMPALGVTLSHVAGRSALPQAVAQYLQEQGLPPVVAVTGDPLLADLSGAGIETRKDCAPDEAAAISVADWAIGETGSVVIHSSPTQPVLHALLPRHWLVVVRESAVLPHLEDYATHSVAAPRNAVMITGSSGTTDIEGFFVRGAHGPGFVHVLLMKG
ncbi:L-lactate dehydrogenase complex protein LldG [Paracoccus isoporae]|uniref:L-lactate dehydrogenase complex protein LldG n=1 Tax=Paracoccus isoporae TaxID=591205 RepID=A0A1G6WL59_9RHOB|nr:LUD domain-containing protein [Paracoccus isoporae]SDD65775.1 L-lactate dehydrogenase complex protein LldG [Paracoccus isoporae]